MLLHFAHRRRECQVHVLVRKVKGIFGDLTFLHCGRQLRKPACCPKRALVHHGTVHLGLFVSYSVSFVSNSPCSISEHHTPLLQALNKVRSDTRITELLCCFPHLPAADAVVSMARVVRVLA